MQTEALLFLEHEADVEVSDKPHCGDCITAVTDLAHCGACAAEASTGVTDTAHCGACV